MTDLAEDIASLIKLNGGQIVGKTRLQKIVYLLGVLGHGFDIEFDYHNFGPFSSELAFAVDDAEALGYISTQEHGGFHAVPYTTYTAEFPCPSLDRSDIRATESALKIMDRYSALVLELAATAVYLKNNGYPTNYWDEVKRRKPSKAAPHLISMAESLLAELGLF
jgi:uncharacterized protein YwgA